MITHYRLGPCHGPASTLVRSDSHDSSPQTCTKISFMAVELGQKGTWNGRWSSCLRFAWHWDIEKPRGRRKTAKGPRTSSVPPGHSEKKTDPSNLCERKMQTIYKSFFVRSMWRLGWWVSWVSGKPLQKKPWGPHFCEHGWSILGKSGSVLDSRCRVRVTSLFGDVGGAIWSDLDDFFLLLVELKNHKDPCVSSWIGEICWCHSASLNPWSVPNVGKYRRYKK